ncbi:MAG TPA: ATP-dependent DNA helicase RecG, partial [Patescibacteria group bacterium]
KGVSSKWLRRQIHTLLEQNLHELKEYLPEIIIKKNDFPSLQAALQEAHYPQNLDYATRAKNRLAFDELFLLQLASQKRRNEWEKDKTIKPYEVIKIKEKIARAISVLPFTLTSAQTKAIEEILADLGKDKPMNRLVQGDVGSGKTIVAAIAMYAAYLNGFQSILMAPTEILANQHYESISQFLSPLSVKLDLVTGSKKTHVSKNVIHNSQKTFDILIGTHALLSEKIKLKKLGLVIIDEQQRFGVEQRGIIKQKGNNPHLLTMTATPIPRTVALTIYGDLALSYINEMPKNRKQVKTWVIPPEKRDAAYAWIKKQIKDTNSQAFIVCPFIEPSESMATIKAVNKEYARLSKDVYPDLKLGLLHGKLKAKEKDEVLQKFKNKEFDILVATPVVEVGIDIPNATIIMIEASEKFGLAQLHQLRGRVGRGDKQSYCLLFTDSKSALNSQRLKGMETLHSGADLAELDLRLRGPGNLYGTAQHGIPKLKVASFSDIDMLQKAKQEANLIFNQLYNYPGLIQKVNEVTVEIVTPD